MINGSPEYGSPAAFRKALDDRLRQTSKFREQSAGELRRRFVFERLLALVSEDESTTWVLKGGTQILLRLPNARSSKDIDLAIRGENLDASVELLTQALRPRSGDLLTFEVGREKRNSDEAVTLSLTAIIGGTTFLNFSIDVAPYGTSLEPQLFPATPVIDVPGLPALGEIPVYPWEAQLADKVCAMYELHGDYFSTRVRDLVDILLITRQTSLDADDLRTALDWQFRHRHMSVERIVLPHPGWNRLWFAEANRHSGRLTLPTRVDDALSEAAICLNPVLACEVRDAQWRPGEGWRRANE